MRDRRRPEHDWWPLDIRSGSGRNHQGHPPGAGGDPPRRPDRSPPAGQPPASEHLSAVALVAELDAFVLVASVDGAARRRGPARGRPPGPPRRPAPQRRLPRRAGGAVPGRRGRPARRRGGHRDAVRPAPPASPEPPAGRRRRRPHQVPRRHHQPVRPAGPDVRRGPRPRPPGAGGRRVGRRRPHRRRPRPKASRRKGSGPATSG